MIAVHLVCWTFSVALFRTLHYGIVHLYIFSCMQPLHRPHRQAYPIPTPSPCTAIPILRTPLLMKPHSQMNGWIDSDKALQMIVSLQSVASSIFLRLPFRRQCISPLKLNCCGLSASCAGRRVRSSWPLFAEEASRGGGSVEH